MLTAFILVVIVLCEFLTGSANDDEMNLKRFRAYMHTYLYTNYVYMHVYTFVHCLCMLYICLCVC